METEVVIASDEVSLYLDVVDGVVLPQPEPAVHIDSSNDSNEHSDDDADDEGQPILGNHHDPIRGLSTVKFHSNSKDRAKLDEWFRSPTMDHLEELSFNDGLMRWLPMSALCLAPTLRLAKFMNFHPQPLNDTPALFLPRLEHLEIVYVCIPKDDMKRERRCCTALEFLHLHEINGLSSFHITSMTLRTIYVSCWCYNKRSQKVYHGMVIEDTPSLERLLVVDQQCPTTNNVISAPKLTVVGYSSVKYSELIIGSTPVQRVSCAAPVALRAAVDEGQQFTMHAMVDTRSRFTELSVVYTNNPVLVEHSIHIMEMLLAEVKYKVVGFNLKYTRAHSRSRPKVVVAQMCVRNHILVYHYC
ncbi:hypothetical protein D1007_27859 [Hordeum vulgare]|nr:hypothetical protein D1007_27859 [Hordeum vulgare]